MDSPSPDREPNIWAHKPPAPFERTATALAKLGAQINRRFDTWAVQEEMHHALMGDIKSFAQEAFREGAGRRISSSLRAGGEGAESVRRGDKEVKGAEKGA